MKKWSSVAPILIDIEPLPFTSVKVYLLDVPRRGDWIMQWWWLAMGQRTGMTTGWSRTPGTPTGGRRGSFASRGGSPCVVLPRR